MLIIGILCWHCFFDSETSRTHGNYISLNTLLMLKLAEYGLSYHIYYTLKNVVD
ncbi:Uncharacterised protein [Serratia fonticola]|nr:Uncharacterised protein [Serratia fonticola]